MFFDEKIQELAKNIFHQSPSGESLSVKLDCVLCISLAASIISTSISNGQSEEKLSFDYWIGRIGRTHHVEMRDILYDVIYPRANPDLRKAVDYLAESNVNARTFTSITYNFFSFSPDQTFIRDFVDYIVEHHYSQIFPHCHIPLPVSMLCVEILKPINGLFYDFTAGFGTNCITAYKHSQNKEGHLGVYAYEANATVHAVSVVRTFIHNIPYTATSFEDFVEYSPYLFANHHLSFVSQDIHQIENLRHGRGIVITSAGVLYDSTNRHVRKNLIYTKHIEAVIALPGNILDHTAAPLYMLVMNKYEPEKDPNILMIQTDTLFQKNNTTRIIDGLTSIINKVTSIYENRLLKDGVSTLVSFDELVKEDYVLLPNRYVRPSSIKSEIGSVSIDLAKMQNWPKIGDFAKSIYRGLVLPKKSLDNTGQERVVINYADVQDGELNFQNLKMHVIKNPERYIVYQNDVIVSCKGVTIKTCVIPPEAEGACLSLNFIGIRLDKSECDPRYLKYYLDSPVGLAYLKSRQIGTSIKTLKNADLKDMPILLPPIDKQKEIVKEFESRQQEIIEKINRLQSTLIDEKNNLYQQMKLGDVMAMVDE